MYLGVISPFNLLQYFLTKKKAGSGRNNGWSRPKWQYWGSVLVLHCFVHFGDYVENDLQDSISSRALVGWLAQSRGIGKQVFLIESFIAYTLQSRAASKVLKNLTPFICKIQPSIKLGCFRCCLQVAQPLGSADYIPVSTRLLLHWYYLSSGTKKLIKNGRLLSLYWMY